MYWFGELRIQRCCGNSWHRQECLCYLIGSGGGVF
jgi:hypothetical protein